MASREAAREAALDEAKRHEGPHGYVDARDFGAGFEAGADWQREQDQAEVARQLLRIADLTVANDRLETALAECREALADLRQNARCSTDPAFVRAFDAATAILARTAPEVGAASRSGGATPVDAPRVSGADAPSGGVSRSPLPEVVNGPAAKSGRVGSTVEDLFQALKDSLARTDPEGEQ